MPPYKVMMNGTDDPELVEDYEIAISLAIKGGAISVVDSTNVTVW